MSGGFVVFLLLCCLPYIRMFYKMTNMQDIPNWKLRWFIIILTLLLSCCLAWIARLFFLLLMCYCMRINIESIFANSILKVSPMWLDFILGVMTLQIFGVSGHYQSYISHFRKEVEQ